MNRLILILLALMLTACGASYSYQGDTNTFVSPVTVQPTAEAQPNIIRLIATSEPRHYCQTTGDVNVRPEPTMTKKPLGYLVAGEVIEYHAITEDGYWKMVTYKGQPAFVYSAYCQAEVR